MPEKPIQRTDPRPYLESFSAFRAAKRRLAEIAAMIKRAADATKDNWEQASIEGLPDPPRPGVSGGGRVFTSQWPTFEEIRRAVQNYRESEQKMNAAWRGIPEQEQEGLMPPLEAVK
jgi:hypothetical protein